MMGKFVSVGLSGVQTSDSADPAYKAPVATPGSLAPGQAVGETRSVVDIGNGNPGVAVWDGSAWHLDGGADKYLIMAATNYGNNTGNRRTRAIGSAANYRFSFDIPPDFGTLVSAVMVGSSSSTISGGDVEVTTEYGDHTTGEARDLNTEGPTVVATLPTLANDLLVEVPVDAVLTGIAPGDSVGMFIEHLGIGGTVNYQNLVLVYTPDREV